MTGSELLPLIQASGRTDRYSLNLYKWVRKHCKVELFVAVATSEEKSYDPAKTQASNLYVGFHDLDGGWLSGARLSEILCNGTKTAKWAFQPSNKFVIVPDWWQGYIAGGKCFIDPEHRLYVDRERWQESEDGKSRKCVWCGNHTQYLHTYQVEQQEWRNINVEKEN